MYAIIETGGKQYKVAEGDIIKVEKLPLDADSEITFDRVLVVSDDDNVQVGNPVVAGAKVTGKILAQGRDKKIIVFKYKPKKAFRKRAGHRQYISTVQIEKIEA